MPVAKGAEKAGRIVSVLLLLAREGPAVQSFNDTVAFRLLPVTTEPAKHTDLQHLTVGGLEVKGCQYKDSKACLGDSDMVIIAIAYNHT